jgi:hypothetical protein
MSGFYRLGTALITAWAKDSYLRERAMVERVGMLVK